MKNEKERSKVNYFVYEASFNIRKRMRILEYAAAILSIRNESLILQCVPRFMPFVTWFVRGICVCRHVCPRSTKAARCRLEIRKLKNISIFPLSVSYFSILFAPSIKWQRNDFHISRKSVHNVCVLTHLERSERYIEFITRAINSASLEKALQQKALVCRFSAKREERHHTATRQVRMIHDTLRL